jgi:hypothetical protein
MLMRSVWAAKGLLVVNFTSKKLVLTLVLNTLIKLTEEGELKEHPTGLGLIPEVIDTWQGVGAVVMRKFAGK